MEKMKFQCASIVEELIYELGNHFLCMNPWMDLGWSSITNIDWALDLKTFFQLHLKCDWRCLLCDKNMWQLIIVQVFDFVKDEWCFSPFSFMKSKFQNWLTTHLDVVIWMFVQKFYAHENGLYLIVTHTSTKIKVTSLMPSSMWGGGVG
jgi:hypothetical protein